jgi:outer membrane protein insertion porin family
MERSLETWLRAKGYYAVDVEAVWDKTKAVGGRINVRFEIKRGAQYRIGQINIRGTERVRPQFMARRFGDLRGEVYDPAQVDERYRELQRTGMFRRLRVIPRETGPNTVDLDVEVEEAPQKEIGLELGFGSYDGLIAGVRFSDKNFLRSGRPASLRLEHAQRGFRGEFLYTDPWFRESDWSLRARLYSELRQERGYDKNGYGGRLDFSRDVTDRWEVSAFVEGASSSLESTGIEEIFLGPTSYTLAAIGVASTLDYRDDEYNPRRGWILRNTIELNAIDNEIAFTRLTAKYSYYRSIGRSLIAIGLRAGWIIPANDASDVPIDLRYFNGGATTVRSFAERELGPRDKNGIPIGGTWFTVANIEWDFPITEALSGALFADAGNLFNDEAPGINDLRYALGIGIRYRLPIGPLRLDYGFNPDRREFEDIGAFHLSFGFAF